MKKTTITTEELGFKKDHIIRSAGKHNVYLKEHVISLNDDLKLFRYISLSTLINMLYNETLYVSNMQSFSKKKKKTGLKKDIEPSPNITAVPAYHDRIRIQREEKDRQKVLSICVSCWTMDNRGDGENDESFLMWKAYTGNEITCRVATNLENLIKSLKDNTVDIVISDVVYNDHCKMTECEKLLFRKSIHYEQEQEVRMVVLNDNPNGISIQIDIGSLLSEIRLSPFIQPNTANFILDGLRKRCSKYPNIVLSYSDILEYKNFK